MLRFLTAGESHGRALVVVLEGIPAGLHLDIDAIDQQLRRRQGGYGRGRRMAIESDRAQVLSGVRRGETIGGPIALMIENRDWANWQHTMSLDANPATGRRWCPARTGHAAETGPCRSCRGREVRTRGRPGHPRARQRPGDSGPGRSRCNRASAPRIRRDPHHEPRLRARRHCPAFSEAAGVV